MKQTLQINKLNRVILIITIFMILSSGAYFGSGLVQDPQDSISTASSGKRILILHANEGTGATNIQTTLTGSLYLVDIFNIFTSTISLSQLNSYDLVITIGGNTPTDAVSTGDVLADYVDNGGKLLMFAYGYVSIWAINGRLQSDGYMPLTAANNDNIARIYDSASTHPILNGLTDITASSMNTVVTAGATVLASFIDGEEFIAEKGNVVLVNSYYSAMGGTDKNTMVQNSANYLLNHRALVMHSSELTGASDIAGILTGFGFSVDLFDSYTATTSLAFINNYDLVITMGGNAPTDAVSTGDVLADYVDNGGKLLMFAYGYVSIWAITGRLQSEGYMPLTADNNDNLDRIYDSASTHSILIGLTDITANSMNTVVTSGATVLASFTDGVDFVAEKGNVLLVNTYYSLLGGTDKVIFVERLAAHMVQSKILILHTNELAGGQAIKINLENFGYRVDLFDMQSSTPDLATLSQYEVVFTIGDVIPLDPINTGNNLADYVDNGGKIVAFAYTFVGTWSITGRLLSEGYFPISAIKNDNILRNYDLLSNHFVLNNIAAMSASSMNVNVSVGATVLASFLDATPFVAERRNVLGINSYYSALTGDVDTLIRNSVDYISGKAPADYFSPVFTTVPTNFNMELGSTLNAVSWTASDANPSKYSLSQDGLELESGVWTDGQKITRNIDGLPVGIYDFELLINDTNGNSAFNVITVTVEDTTRPIIVTSELIEYVEGEIANNIFWEATDVSPGTYSLSYLGVEVVSGPWLVAFQYGYNVDGHTVGIHTYTLDVIDSFGNLASLIINVNVTAATSTSTVTTSPNETSTDDSPTTTTSTTSDAPTTSDQTSTSKSDDGTGSSDTPELPIPFSNIYVIMFSILGLAFIVRKRKN